MAKSSRAEEIYDYIKQQLLSGKWKSGDRLNDSLLAEEIGVSRTSVREALFRLTETGVVEKEYWKGYFLKDITDETVSDIVDIRIALECSGIRNFIREYTPEVLAQLEQVLAASQRLLEEGKQAEYLAMDYSFHETIFNNQHNQYIIRIMENLQLVIHLMRYKSMGSDENFIKTGLDSIGDHRAILEAVKAKDEQLAVSLMSQHLILHQDEVKGQLK